MKTIRMVADLTKINSQSLQNIIRELNEIGSFNYSTMEFTYDDADPIVCQKFIGVLDKEVLGKS